MATPRRLRFVHAQMGWMVVTILVLSVLGALSTELFFVVSLIGFLVVIELTAPRAVTPTWRSRLKWLVLLGLFGFGTVVVNRILAILPFGPSNLFELLRSVRPG